MSTVAEGEKATARPRVSVVIPAWNEAKFIRPCLESILGGDYPAHAMEVVVVDGNSTDRTREIVEELSLQDPRVRLLHNPRGITPAALNIGIRAARGEVIVRADAHSHYPPQFVSALVRALDDSGADMVGACSENFPSEETAICEAIVLATNSPFGTGSRFRYHRKSGPVDAVQLGCWRKELFDRVGYFDERLLRNQDNEHSSRILSRGGTLWMTAEVCIKYYPRPSLSRMCKHGAANGTWNAFTQRLHPYTFRWRHFLPALLFLGVCAAALAVCVAAVTHTAWLAAFGVAIVAPYALCNLAFSIFTGWSRRRIGLSPLIAVVLAAYHFSYGFGIVKGWTLVATGGWRTRIGGGLKEARLRC